MAGLHSTPRFVEHRNLVEFSMYDGGTQAVERYLELSFEDTIARLLVGCADVEPIVVRRQHEVVDYSSDRVCERVIEGTGIELLPSSTSTTKDECLTAASLLVEAFKVCGKVYSQEASGKEICTSEIQQEVFSSPA